MLNPDDYKKIVAHLRIDCNGGDFQRGMTEMRQNREEHLEYLVREAVKKEAVRRNTPQLQIYLEFAGYPSSEIKAKVKTDDKRITDWVVGSSEHI